MNPRTLEEKRFYSSLTRNMVITIVVLAVTPLILISAVTRHYFQGSFRDEVLVHLRTVAELARARMDLFMENRLAAIRLLARSFPMEKLSDEAFLKELLLNLQEDYGPSVVDLGLIDDKGIEVAHAGPGRSSAADHSKSLWFRKALETEHHISDILPGRSGKPHLVMTATKDSQGRKWVLKAAIDVEPLNSMVDSMRSGSTGVGFVLNAKGEPQTRIKPGIGIEPERYSRLTAGHGNSGEVATAEVCDGRGVEVVELATRLGHEGWILGFRQSGDETYAAMFDARRVAVGCFVAGIVVIVAVAVVLSRRMVSRLQRTEHEKRSINDQLIEAGKLASLGELAAGIAHEINNPVSVMVEEAGWIRDIVEDEDLTKAETLEELRRGLSKIQTQGRRCKDITHKLLSFARKTDHTLKPVQLNGLVTEVISLSEKRALYSGVTVTTRLQEDLPMVNASPSEIQQVLLNMINNSPDSIGEKGGNIYVSSKVEGKFVVIEISDDGPGIPDGVLPRIFDPFFTTKPVGKGTGLGLSICYGIVKKMGGDIHVDSSSGQGVSFHIHLPVPETEESQA